MTPALIAAIAELIATLGPLGLKLFLTLESQLNLGPDEKTNVANAIAAANAASDDTIAAVADWMKANGFRVEMKFVPPAA